MTIIQTSNHGILLSGFPEGIELVGIEVDLSLNGDTLKHWGISDVEVDGANIICPLTQNETESFPKGIARLEAKCIDSDGTTHHAVPQSVKIDYRVDRTIQGDGDYSSDEYAEVPIVLTSDTAIIRKGYSPYIDDDGIWWEYSTSDKSFVNTGVSAKGDSYTITQADYDSIADKTKDILQPTISELDITVQKKIDKPVEAPAVGKVLKVKQVNEDGSFVCEWADGGSGGGAVDDVTVDGTSVVTDGIAEIPLLSKTGERGLPMISSAGGLQVNQAGNLELTRPTIARIKSRGLYTYEAVNLSNADQAVKHALCDTGTGTGDELGKPLIYTAEEQSAAQARLGIYPMNEEGY